MSVPAPNETQAQVGWPVPEQAGTSRRAGLTRRRTYHLAADFLPDLTFACVLVIVGLARWAVINSNPVPPGLDGGNWLALGHSLMGSRSRSSSILYPPVVPLLSVGASAIWGPMLGTKIVATLASLAPAAGVYFLLRERLGARAILLATLLASAASVGEAAAWGGYPQLLGLGLLGFVLWALDRLMSTESLWWAWTASLLVCLTVATNDLIGPIAVAVSMVYIAVRYVSMKEAHRPPKRLLVEVIVLGALPSIAFAPTYLALTQGVVRTEAAKISDQHITIANLWANLANIFKEAPAMWFVLLAIAILSPIAIRNRSARALAAASIAVFVPALLALLALQDARALYLLPTATIVGVATWWKLLVERRGAVANAVDRALIGATLVVVATQFALGMAAYQQQTAFYQSLSPGLVAGMEQLNASASKTAVLAVSPAPNQVGEDGWPLGRWVEGLLDRPTYYASDLQWLNYPDEQRRAVVANSMFSSESGPRGAIDIAQQHGIDFIVVAKAWPQYKEWIASSPTYSGGNVIIDTDTLLVIQVAPK